MKNSNEKFSQKFKFKGIYVALFLMLALFVTGSGLLVSNISKSSLQNVENQVTTNQVEAGGDEYYSVYNEVGGQMGDFMFETMSDALDCAYNYYVVEQGAGRVAIVPIENLSDSGSITVTNNNFAFHLCIKYLGVAGGHYSGNITASGPVTIHLTTAVTGGTYTLSNGAKLYVDEALSLPDGINVVVNTPASYTSDMFLQFANSTAYNACHSEFNITFNGSYTTEWDAPDGCYAQYVAPSYSISYTLNGGSYGSYHPTSMTVGSGYTVSNPTRTGSGWAFMGWDITGMDSTTHYYGTASNNYNTSTATSLSEITSTWFKNLRSSSGTVTFTAQWVYKLAITLNGGSIVIDYIPEELTVSSDKTVSNTQLYVKYGSTEMYVNEGGGYGRVRGITCTKTDYVLNTIKLSTANISVNTGTGALASAYNRSATDTLVVTWADKWVQLGINLNGGTSVTFTSSTGYHTFTSDTVSSNSCIYACIGSTYIYNQDNSSGTKERVTLISGVRAGYALSSTFETSSGNYTFNTSSCAFTSTYSTSGTDTLEIAWSTVKYSITFARNSGNLNGSASNVTWSNLNLDQVYRISDKITSATRSGYAFAGWKATSNLNTSSAYYSSNNSTWSGWSNTNTVIGNTYYIKNLANTNGTTVTLTAQWATFSYGTTSVTKTYGNSAFTNTLTNSTGYTPTYSSTNTSVATVNSSGQVTIAAAGSSTIKASVTSYGITTEVSYSLTVNKADVSLTAPTAISPTPVYTGSALNVMTTGSVTGGTLYYSANNSSWSTTRPTKTNAGSYTVYYKVTGDANHNDVASTSLSVSIAQATNSWTTALSCSGFTYTGTATPSPSSAAKFGSPSYAYKVSTAADSTYTSTKPTAAGTYTVRATVSGTTNYTGLTATTNFTISKATNPISVTATQSGSVTFSTSNQDKTFTAATGAQGAVTYAINSQKDKNNTTVSSFSIPTSSTASFRVAGSTGVSGSNYTIVIRATAAGNDNYNSGYKDITYTLTISKATNPISVTASQSGSVTFSTSNQNKSFTAASSAQGAVTYAIQSQENKLGDTVTYFSIPTASTASFRVAANSPAKSDYTIVIRATAAGNDNYNSGYKDITYTLNIDKAANPISVTTPQSGSATYAPSAHGNAFTAATGGQGAVTYSIQSQKNANNTNVSYFTIPIAANYEFVIGDNTPVNTYTIVIRATAAGNDNYESGSKDITYTLTINRANITPVVSMSGYTYAGTKSSPSISSGNPGSGTVTYYYNTSNSNSGGTAWTNVTSSTSLNAGDYYMYATVGATTNYNSGTSAAVKFTISKASITPVVSMSGYTYAGTKSSPSISSGNPGSGTVTYYYNTSNSNSGGTAWTNVTSSTSLNAGDYYMYATVAATTNYNSGTSAAVKFTISKATNPLSFTDSQSGSVTFSTSAQNKTFTAATGGQGAVIYSIQGQTENKNGTAVSYFTIGTPSNNQFSIAASSPANTYTITIRASAAGNTNYNAGSKDITYTLTISRASISPTLSMSGYTYAGTVSTPSVSGNTGSGTVTYKYSTSENGTYSTWSGITSTSLNAGTYWMYAEVAQTTNYSSGTTAKKSFTISRASISPTLTMSGYTYAGTVSTPSVSGNTGSGTVTYKYSTSENGTYSTWSGITNTTLNAGTYWMYAEVAQTTNYNSGTTGKKSFTIAQANNPMTVTASQSSSFVFTTSAKDVAFTAAANAQGSVTYAISSQENKIGDTVTYFSIPTNTTASFRAQASTPTNNEYTIIIAATAAGNTNYKSATKNITYTLVITKAANPISVTATQSGSVTFSTSNQDKSFTAATNAVGAVTYAIQSQEDKHGEAISNFTIPTASTASFRIPGSQPVSGSTYTIVIRATAAGNDNYNSGYKDITYTLTINKADNPISVTATQSGSVTFSTSAQDKGFTAASSGQGAVTYAIQSQKNKNNTTVSSFSIPTASTASFRVAASTGVSGSNYTIVIRATAAGNDNYNSGYKDITYTLTINKAANPISVTASQSGSVTFSTSNQDKSFTGASSNQGSVTYAIQSQENKLGDTVTYFSIPTASTASFRVAANSPAKSDYTIVIRATAAGNDNYNSGYKDITYILNIDKAANPISVTATQSGSVTFNTSNQDKSFTGASSNQGAVTYAIQSQTDKHGDAISNFTIPTNTTASFRIPGSQPVSGSTYTIVIRATAAGNDNYNSGYKDITYTLTIDKAANPISVTATQSGSVTFSTSNQDKSFTAATGAQGAVTYAINSQKDKNNTAVSSFSIPTASTASFRVAASTGVSGSNYTIVIRATAAGNDNYNSGYKDITYTLTINKAANPISVTASQSGSVTFSTSNQDKSFTGASNNQGSVTYAIQSQYDKVGDAVTYFSIPTASTASFRVAGNSPAKYDYEITIRATAAGNDNYNSGYKDITYILAITKAANPISVTTPQSGSATYAPSAHGNAFTAATNAVGAVTYAIKSQTNDAPGSACSYFTIPIAANNEFVIGDNTPVNGSTYTIVITATAAGNDNYESGSKDITYTLTITKQTVNPITNLSISSAGVVTWTASSNATGYQISFDGGTSWSTGTSGTNYNSNITASIGSRSVKVRAVNSDTTNYTTPSTVVTESVTVYSVALTKGTGIATVTGAGNYISGATVTLGATMSTGYSWSKWVQTTGGADVSTTKAYSFAISASQTYTAKATANTYTISYTWNSGTAGTNAPTSGTYDSVVTISNPSRTGYTFTGWTSTTYSSTAKTSSDNSTYSTWTGTSTKNQYFKNLRSDASGTITMVANWSINYYHVTYDATTNGGAFGSDTSQGYLAGDNVVYGGDVDLSTEHRYGEKANWTFVGWNTTSTATSKLTALGMGAEDITLYAIYKKDITINFYQTDGGNDKRDITIWNTATSGSVTSPALDTLSDTYTKVGWGSSTSATSSSWNASTAANVSTNASYYAVYSYTVSASYNANTGSGTMAASTGDAHRTAKTSSPYYSDIAVGIELETCTFTKTGYSFSAWGEGSASGTSKDPGKMVSLSSNQTYYAKWDANTYTISYALNGGSHDDYDSLPTTATYDESFTVANAYFYGQVFLGWDITGLDSCTHYVGASSSNNSTSTSTALYNVRDEWFMNLRATSGTVTFTARFKPAELQYVLHKNNGSGGSDYGYVVYGQTVSDIEPPTRTGYIFLGYFADDAAGNMVYDASGTHVSGWNGITSDMQIDLYAHWEAKYYKLGINVNSSTMTFECNADIFTVSSNISVSSSNYYTRYDSNKIYYKDSGMANYQEIFAITATKTGYTLASLAGSNFALTVTTTARSTSTISTTMTADYTTDSTDTLVATWGANYYALGISPGGGAFTFTRSGGDWDVSALTEVASTRLYAKYGSTTLYYSASDPVYDGYSATAYAITSITAAKTGYTLSTWTGAETAISVSSGTPANVLYSNYASTTTDTLTATWEADTFKIVFNSNKPSNASASISGSTADKTATYGTTCTLTTNGYSLTGWTFAGWAESASGAVTRADGATLTTAQVRAYYLETGVGKNGTKTLYAKWTANSHTVTLNQQGGNGGSTSVTAYYDSDMPEIDLPTKSEYVFKGYYTGTNGSGTKYYNADGSSARKFQVDNDLTLNAYWDIVYYQLGITLDGGTMLISEGEQGSETTQPISSNIAAASSSYYARMNSTKLYWKNGGNYIKIDNIAAGKTGYTLSAMAGSYATITVTSGSPANYLSSAYTHEGTDTIVLSWSANTYTITFDQGLGSGGSTSVTATYDSTMPSATMPTCQGHDFLGYFTGTSGTGTKYYNADGSSARTWNLTSNTTLHAYFTTKVITITFESRIIDVDMLYWTPVFGGSITPDYTGTSSITVLWGQQLPSITMPSDDEYVCDGYYDYALGIRLELYHPDMCNKYYSKNGTGLGLCSFESNVTLYASWSKKISNIREFWMSGANSNGSTSPGGNYPGDWLFNPNQITSIRVVADVESIPYNAYCCIGDHGNSNYYRYNKEFDPVYVKTTLESDGTLIIYTPSSQVKFLTDQGFGAGAFSSNGLGGNDTEKARLQLSSLTSIDWTNIYTSDMVAASFEGDISLVNLDLTETDFSGLGYFGGMFYGCSSLETLNISNFNLQVSNTSMVSWASTRPDSWAYENMFAGCDSLGEIYMPTSTTLYRSGSQITLPGYYGSANFVNMSSSMTGTDGSGHAYDFWYTLDNEGYFNDNTVAAADKGHLYRIQELTFDANGGTGASRLRYVKWNTTFQIPASMSNYFTKEGYHISDWYYGPNANDRYSIGTDYSTKYDRTLYATWQKNSYSITYTLNSGTHGTTHPESAYYDTAFYVSAPTRYGYTFAGWTVSGSHANYETAKWGTTSSPATTITNSSTVCVNGASGNVYFLNLTTGDNSAVILTANWTANAFTITFNGNKPSGATGSVTGSTADQTPYYGSSCTLTSNGFVLSGYSFAGWATSSSGAVVYTDGQTINASTINSMYSTAISSYGGVYTLYAKWTQNKYQLGITVNGGEITFTTELDDIDVRSNVAAASSSLYAEFDSTKLYYKFSNEYHEISEITGMRTGYTLASIIGTNCSIAVSDQAANVLSAKYTTAGTDTLVFSWTANTYTVNLDKNMTEATAGTTSVTATYDSPMPTLASVPSRTGYVFQGYFDSGSGGNQYYDGSGISTRNWDKTSNGTILYGQWELLKIFISVDPNNGSLTFTSATDSWTASGNDLIPYNSSRLLFEYSTNKLYIMCVEGENIGTFSQVTSISVTPPTAHKHLSSLELGSGENYIPVSNGTPGSTLSSNYNLTSSDILTAYWAYDVYSITYKDGGNTAFSGTHESGYPTTHTYNTATTLKSATKTGYDFGGWFTTIACTGSAVTTLGAVAYTDDITLYAKWTEHTYSITYKDGGNTAFSGTHESGYPTTHTYNTATTLKSASKDGYDFGGWFTDSGCTGSAVTTLGATAYTADITLYAKWTEHTYSITYKDGGNTAFSGNHVDTPTAHPTSHTYGTATTLNEATKTGYDFDGWFTTSGCTGSAVTTLGATEYTADITLYAKWTAQVYSITYKDDGDVAFSGTHGSGYPTTHTYGTATALVNPTKTGYAFDGWFTESDCSGTAKTSLSATGYTADITLYAKWTANTYNVTIVGVNVITSFELAGTYTAADKTHSTSTGSAINIYAKANTGYGGPTFVVSPEGAASLSIVYESGDVYYVTASGYTDAFTVTVTSTANSYTLTLDANGGSIPETTGYSPAGATETKTKNVTYDSAYGTLPDPTRTGYTFGGWLGPNIVDVADSSNAGIRTGTATSGYFTGAFGTAWVTSHLKTNTTYTISYHIYVDDWHSNGSEGWACGFMLYKDGSTRVNFYDWVNFGTGYSGYRLKTFTTPADLTGYTMVVYTSTGSGGSGQVTFTKLMISEGSTSNVVTDETIVSTSRAHTLYAVWTANPLTFSNQTYDDLIYSPSSQTVTITGASNGTGSYTYSITGGNTGSYFSISGTTITVGAGTPVGTYALTVHAVDNGSGQTADATITIIISNATFTVEDADYSGVYDGLAHGITVTPSIAGTTITYRLAASGEYNLSDNPQYTDVTTTVTVYYQVAKANYNTVTGNATVTITAKTLNIAALSKQYNGTITYTQDVDGVNSETVTVTYTLDADYKDVGTYAKGATAGDGVYVPSLSSSNYAIGTMGDLTITPYQLTSAKITASSKTYVENASTYERSGVNGVGGETVTVIYTPYTNAIGDYTYAASAESGKYTIAVKNNTNYTITGGATFTITPAEIVYTKSDYSAQYDGSAHGITVTVSSPAGTTIAYRESASGAYNLATNPTYTNVGTYTVYFKITKANYADVEDSATVTITQATNSWTTALSCADVTYGSTPSPSTVAKFGTPSYTYKLQSEGDGAYTSTVPTAAGDYTVKATVAGTTNYTGLTATANFTIGKQTVNPITGLTVTNAGVVSWTASSNATGYEISFDGGTSWSEGTSGTNYVENITVSTGTRYVKVRAINSDTDNYTTPSDVVTSSAITVRAVSVTGDHGTEHISRTSTEGSLTTINFIDGATAYIFATADTGYTFSKWSNDSTTANTSITVGSSTATMTATYTANTYSITYMDEGNVAFSGTHESGYPTTHTYGTATTLKSATKTGYDFDGWFTTSGCTGSAITTLGATAYTADITLYAKWTEHIYTITYKDKGDVAFSGTHVDTPNAHPTTHTYGTATTLNGATKAGYEFGGWFTTSGCTGSAVTTLGATDYTDNIVLYARWSANRLTVNIHLNGGVSTGSIFSNNEISYTEYFYYGSYMGDSGLTNVDVGYGVSRTGYTINSPATMYNTIYDGSGITVHADRKYGIGVGEYDILELCSIDMSTSGATLDLYAQWTANPLIFSNQTYDDLIYSTSSQTVSITGASNGTGSYTYSITAGNTNSYFSIDGTTITVAASTPADTYALTVHVVDNGSAQTADATITIVIDKAAGSVTAPTANTLTYNGSAQTLISAGSSTTGTIQYKLGTGSYSTDLPSATNAGTYTVYYKVIGDENHNDVAEASVSVTIAKYTSALTVTITPNTYEYDGTAKTPSVAVKLSNGYTLASSEYTLSGTQSATNVGASYTITATGANVNVGTGATGSGTWSITQATNEWTTALSCEDVTYGEAPSPSAVAKFGTPSYTYKLQIEGDGAYTSTVPTAAGDYTVKATVEGTTNYTGLTATANFKINKADGSVTAPTANTLTYNGSEQTLISAGSSTTGTIQYKLGTGSYSTDLPSATNAGTYTVYYKVIGDENHNDVAEASISVTIAQVTNIEDLTILLDNYSFEYDGSSHTVNVTVKIGNTVLPTSDYNVTGTTTGTAINTYHVTVTGANTNISSSVTTTLDWEIVPTDIYSITITTDYTTYYNESNGMAFVTVSVANDSAGNSRIWHLALLQGQTYKLTKLYAGSYVITTYTSTNHTIYSMTKTISSTTTALSNGGAIDISGEVTEYFAEIVVKQQYSNLFYDSTATTTSSGSLSLSVATPSVVTSLTTNMPRTFKTFTPNEILEPLQQTATEMSSDTDNLTADSTTSTVSLESASSSTTQSSIVAENVENTIRNYGYENPYSSEQNVDMVNHDQILTQTRSSEEDEERDDNEEERD